MNPAKAATTIANQMRLGNSTRGGLTGQARVEHENGTPESRAQAAMERHAKTEMEIQTKAALTQSLSNATQAYIGSESQSLAVQACNRAVIIDDQTIRTALRQAYEAGYRAGWMNRHEHPSL